MWRLVVTVPPLLFAVPVHRLAKNLERRRAGYTAPPIEALAYVVDGWLFRLPGVWHWTCLKRATILYALLRASGEDVQLHIGVKRDTDKTFAAHAWLVRDGQPYLEPKSTEYSTYKVITIFPEAAQELA